MSTSRESHVTTFMGGTILSLGGSGGETSFEKLNTTSNEWTTAEVTLPRRNHIGVSLPAGTLQCHSRCFYYILSTAEKKILLLIIYHKVNRCLARYSPRATTTNQISRQGLAQKEQKCHFRAKLGLFWAKNPNFYWRNQKFCYPHNRKPTQAPCSHCFFLGIGQNVQKMAIFGLK